jgi:hypothetical protein
LLPRLSAFGQWRTLLDFGAERLFAGNENRFGSPFLKLAPNGIMKTLSYVRLLALLIFGNVFPSELIGQIEQLNLLRNPDHRPYASGLYEYPE